MTTSEIIILLLPAIAQVESNNNPRAYNPSAGDAGILQITPIFVDDLNRIHGKIIYTYNDRWDVEKSKEMATKYLVHYGTERRLGRKPTAEDLARIFHGGPNGFKKEHTKKYWVKVENVLKAQNK
jgi:hypothetical protein